MGLRQGLFARFAEDSDLSRNTRVVQKKGSDITCKILSKGGCEI